MKENKPELKIFEMRSGGEKVWVCAYTNIHAIKVLLNIQDQVIGEYDDEDEIVEIPKDKWGEHVVKNADHDGDDWKEMTFEEWMEGRTDPDIIATTIY